MAKAGGTFERKGFMRLEDQVCSLDLARRLKELGVRQESVFRHDTKLGKLAWRGDIQIAPVEFGDRYISAFTVAELGEMLPKYQASWRASGARPTWMMKDVLGDETFTFSDGSTLQARTEADARAKMLVHLLENKLLRMPRTGTD